MTRLSAALALVVVFCSLQPASAILTTPRPVDRTALRTAAKEAPPRESDGEFVLTEGSEVLVDGRPVAYKDVPTGASVVRIEVAGDRRTILRIEFRTRK